MKHGLNTDGSVDRKKPQRARRTPKTGRRTFFHIFVLFVHFVVQDLLYPCSIRVSSVATVFPSPSASSGGSAGCGSRAGTVCRLISRIDSPAISASASLKRRKFVEKKIVPPGVISSASRLSSVDVVPLDVPIVLQALLLEKVGASTTARSKAAAAAAAFAGIASRRRGRTRGPVP